jgi:hypothetical protein
MLSWARADGAASITKATPAAANMPKASPIVFIQYSPFLLQAIITPRVKAAARERFPHRATAASGFSGL